MPVLRFPNPVSDVPKFVDVFRLIYRNLKGQTNFDHDALVKVLIENNQASSCGTVGKAALKRSTREDRSRDPLFNQAKMYSELFRMLGWLHCGTDSGHFVFSEVAPYIDCEKNSSSLIEESLYSIVFPNPHVENRGGHVLRPFFQILRMMRELDGQMSRDEMIIAVLSLMNDRDEKALANQVQKIKELRGSTEKLVQALQTAAGNLQVNTAKNYTRFPLGVIRTANWAEPASNDDLYDEATRVYQLTPLGESVADKLLSKTDVRDVQIQQFGDEERAAFILLSTFSMFQRAGFDMSGVQPHFDDLKAKCRGILEMLGTDNFNDIVYSPYQQAQAKDLALANKLDKSLGQ